jgi:hypothetical protein
LDAASDFSSMVLKPPAYSLGRIAVHVFSVLCEICRVIPDHFYDVDKNFPADSAIHQDCSAPNISGTSVMLTLRPL